MTDRDNDPQESGAYSQQPEPDPEPEPEPEPPSDYDFGDYTKSGPSYPTEPEE